MGWKAIPIFLLFVLLVAWASTGFKSPASTNGSVPNTGGVLESILRPGPTTDPAIYDATAQAARMRADTARTANAQDYLDRQAATQSVIRAEADVRARQTQIAGEATAAVSLQLTQTAVAATLDAARAQATTDAHITATFVRQTQAAGDLQATADAINFQSFVAKKTQEYRQAENDAQWKNMLTGFDHIAAYWPLALLVFVLVAGSFGGYRFLRMREKTNLALIPQGPTGESFAAVMEGVVIHPARMAGASIDPRDPAFVASVDHQMDITRRAQAVDAIGRMPRSGFSRQAREGAEMLGATAQIGAQPQIESGDDDLPEVAPWADFTSNWRGGTFALGLGAGNAGIVLDPRTVPNLMVAGTTNSGKTHRAVVPLMAEALSDNWQVIALNGKGGDWAALKGHANLYIIDGRADTIAEILHLVAEEVERRNKILRDTSASTYYRLTNAEQAIGPRIMVVVDELVSLINGAPSNQLRNELWSAAVDITSRCRAMGMMMLIATTDPTNRTLGRQGLSVRDNCGRMIFRLRDGSSSMAALDVRGAEMLTGAQFLAQLDTPTPVRGVAFHPQDEEVKAFLAAHPARVLPAPAWLTPRPAATDAPLVGEVIDPQPAPTEASVETRVRKMAADGKSNNEIQQEVFGKVGGTNFYRVQSILKGSNTSNNNTARPENGAVPAD